MIASERATRYPAQLSMNNGVLVQSSMDWTVCIHSIIACAKPGISVGLNGVANTLEHVGHLSDVFFN